MNWETRLNSDHFLPELGHSCRLDLLAQRQPGARRYPGCTARLAWRLGGLLIALGQGLQRPMQAAIAHGVENA